MLHPATQLRVVDPQRGYGVVATEEIPRGALIWVLDALDTAIPPGNPLFDRPEYARIVETYTFEMGDGSRLLHWDLAKYINHSCDANLVTPRWAAFSIAIRPIHVGEELTDDYALYHGSEDAPMPCLCGSPRCRGVIDATPAAALAEQLTERLVEVLAEARTVAQPLRPYLQPGWHADLEATLERGCDRTRARFWLTGR